MGCYKKTAQFSLERITMKKRLLSLLISISTFSSFSSDRPDPKTMTDAQIEHELELLEENGTERTLSTLSFDDIKNYKERLEAFQSKVSSEHNIQLLGKSILLLE